MFSYLVRLIFYTVVVMFCFFLNIFDSIRYHIHIHMHEIGSKRKARWSHKKLQTDHTKTMMESSFSVGKTCSSAFEAKGSELDTMLDLTLRPDQ